MADTSGEDLDETLVWPGGGDWNHLASNRGTARGTGDEAESNHLSIRGLRLGRHGGYLTERGGYKVRIHNEKTESGTRTYER